MTDLQAAALLYGGGKVETEKFIVSSWFDDSTSEKNIEILNKETKRIVVLSPVFLILAVAIYIDDPGPILFTQKRVGKNKEFFKLHKFRSMKMCTPHDKPTHMLENPEFYITRVGKFLRAHSLDELPQIWDSNPVKYQFATPVFIDCDDSFCMDPIKLRQFCEEECVFEDGVLKYNGQSVKAIVVVHGCYAYVMPQNRSIDIDTELDFMIAETIMKAGVV